MVSLSKLKQGDLVKVKTSKSTLKGRVVSVRDSKLVVIKISSGYNIGLSKKGIHKIKKLKSEKLKSGSPKLKIEKSKELPDISLITTGGTITSRVDYKTGAVYPLEEPEELLANIPELSEVANIKKIRKPFSVLSEDMQPSEWQELAEKAAEELNSGAKGLIITHGTDILHYTAAALSFMLEDLNKPVALVGGQRSSDRGSFDGALNLICSAHYCKSDIAEVATVMHGTEEDNYCLANRGTKVRKMSSSRRDTFRPINELPLAKIDKSGKLEVINEKYNERSKGKVKANTKFENKVALVKMHPGADPDIINYYLKKGYKGLVIEGTGFGHVSTQPKKEEKNWLPVIKKAVNKGMFIGITSQAFYGRTDPYIYSAGRLMKEAGAVFLGDMLPETAYVKLSWVLGQTKKKEKVKEMMLTNIAGEINDKIPDKAFLY